MQREGHDFEPARRYPVGHQRRPNESLPLVIRERVVIAQVARVVLGVGNAGSRIRVGNGDDEVLVAGENGTEQIEVIEVHRLQAPGDATEVVQSLCLPETRVVR